MCIGARNFRVHPVSVRTVNKKYPPPPPPLFPPYDFACQQFWKAYIFISRGAEGPGREILQRPPSVCLSVCNLKTHQCIFAKLCKYVHHVMGGGGGGPLAV